MIRFWLFWSTGVTLIGPTGLFKPECDLIKKFIPQSEYVNLRISEDIHFFVCWPQLDSQLWQYDCDPASTIDVTLCQHIILQGLMNRT